MGVTPPPPGGKNPLSSFWQPPSLNKKVGFTLRALQASGVGVLSSISTKTLKPPVHMCQLCSGGSNAERALYLRRELQPSRLKNWTIIFFSLNTPAPLWDFSIPHFTHFLNKNTRSFIIISKSVHACCQHLLSHKISNQVAHNQTSNSCRKARSAL